MTNIFRNIRSNFLNRIWVGVIGLVSIPFLLNNLGEGQFGAFSLFSIVIMYFTVADLGLSKSVVRFVTLYRNTEKLDLVYSNFLSLFICFSVLLFFIGMIFEESLLLFLKLNVVNEYIVIYRMCLLVAISMVVRSFFIGIIYAYEKFSFFNNINVCVETIKWSLVVFVSNSENALVYVFFVQLAVLISHTIILAVYSQKLTPIFSLKLTLDFLTAKEILGFSSQIALSDFFVRLMTYCDKIVVTVVGSIVGLSSYYIAFQVASKVFEIPSNILLVYYSRFGASFARKDMVGLRADFINSTRVTVILVVPIILSVFGAAVPMMELWLHNDSASIVAAILKIFCAGVLGGSILLPSINLSNAVGVPKLPLKNNVFASILLLGMSVFLFGRHGASGGAIAWSFVQFMPLIFVVPKLCEILSMSYREYVAKSILIPIIKIVAVFVFAECITLFLEEGVLTYLLLANLLSLIVIYRFILVDSERIWLNSVIKNV